MSQVYRKINMSTSPNVPAVRQLYLMLQGLKMQKKECHRGTGKYLGRHLLSHGHKKACHRGTKISEAMSQGQGK